jgi:hypothetical protein
MIVKNMKESQVPKGFLYKTFCVSLLNIKSRESVHMSISQTTLACFQDFASIEAKDNILKMYENIIVPVILKNDTGPEKNS